MAVDHHQCSELSLTDSCYQFIIRSIQSCVQHDGHDAACCVSSWS